MLKNFFSALIPLRYCTQAVFLILCMGLYSATSHADETSAPIPAQDPVKAEKYNFFERIKAAAHDLLRPKSDTEIWLARIQDAARKNNYSGTFVYQQGAQFQTSRITHFVDPTGEYEKLEVLDGNPRELLRHDDEVRCYMPEKKLIFEEKRVKSDSFPALLSAPPTEIEAHYKFSHTTIERVGGRICNVVTLEPRDKLRYGYRLWSDQESGLLLKSQTLNERNEVVEQVAFTNLFIDKINDVSISRALIQPSYTNVEGWRVVKYQTIPAHLLLTAWSAESPIPGFHRVMEIKRSLGEKHEVGQIVYSDGLAVISIFVEPGDAASMPAGTSNAGPINIVSKPQGTQWLTVVGEAPAASIQQVANSVEFKLQK